MRIEWGGDGTTGEVHPVLGPVRTTVRELGWWPDEQVGQTVQVMRDRVNEDAGNPQFAQRALALVDAPTDMEKVQAAYNHVHQAVNFQRDEEIGKGMAGIPEDELIEVIIRPVDLAIYVDKGIAVGDCDDFSMYLAALLKCVGVPCAFATVAADGRAPDQYSHVYVAAYPRDETGNRVRVPLDASHGKYAGWEVPNQYGKLKEWPVDGGGFGGWVIASVVGGLIAMWAWKNREAFA